MKKIITIMLLIIFVISLSGCEKGNNQKRGTYTEYSDSENLKRDCYYEIASKAELDIFSTDIYHNEEALNRYNEEYFENNALVIFLISESSGGNRHQINTLGISSEGVLELNSVLTNVGVTCDMEYWTVFYELTKEEFNKLSSIKLIQEHIGNTKVTIDLQSYHDYQTTLPKDMPDDFHIYVSGYLGEDIEFDSRTGYLEYGKMASAKNNETTLLLSKEKLKEIYDLFRGVTFDKYPRWLYISHSDKENDQTHIYVVLSGTDVYGDCAVLNINNLEVDAWYNHQELGNALAKFINDYIKNTDEFKSLAESVNK